MLTGEGDGTLTFVENPGQTNQAVSFLQLIDPNTGAVVANLDDCVFVTTPSGSFYLTDTGNNRVLKIDVSDMEVPSLLGSVPSLNMLANIDMTTGVVTPFLPNLNGPHGLEYIPRFTSLFGR
jgi:DNA-binding beta-propeller fold protein YncE